MILIVSFLLLYQIVIADIQQHYVVINCSWPCPTITDACILTKNGAQCQPKIINEWNIITPSKSPVYTGAYSSVENHTCIPAPIPSLPIYRNTTVLLNNQTVIQWPIISTYKALDDYLGNCNHGMFCSSTGEDEAKPICRKGYAPGSKCISSNQCRRDYCSSGICYQSTQQESQDSTDTEAHRQTKNTIIIAATIVSVLGVIAIIVLVIAVIRYRRRRVKHHMDSANNINDFDLFNESDFDSPPLKAQIRQVSVDTTQEDVLPSMQQNALQKELRKNYHKHPAKPSSYQI
jgi:hypothetical protein